MKPEPAAAAADAIRDKAHELGFSWFATAPVGRLERELEDLRGWLVEGRHGDMAWLAKDPDRRADPELVLEGCRTVVVVGLNYLREPLPKIDELRGENEARSAVGKISRYARTRDYHRVIEKLLRKLARFIDATVPAAHSRGYVDYGPVMERPWAKRAGIGFLGKHTLLIHPKEGSFHFLGVILTTAVLDEQAAEVAPSAVAGCGDCRRCIDACPTGAITAEWQLDARRCLSYLTIEKQGAYEEPAPGPNKGWVFGCDICQEVCPYNQARARHTEDSALGPLLIDGEVSLRDLIGNPEGFLSQFEGTSSPLKRTGAEGLLRNAIAVASELGDPRLNEYLSAVEEDESRPQWLREMARAAKTA